MDFHVLDNMWTTIGACAVAFKSPRPLPVVVHPPRRRRRCLRSLMKTGGGPALKITSESTEKNLELLQETPSFSGLKGFETGLSKYTLINIF